MSKKYTADELNTMEKSLYNGMPVDELHSLLFPRKKTAIVKKAQDFNYGAKIIDGVQRFYFNIETRNRRTKAELDAVLAEKEVIVGEARTARTVQEPTILSEQTTENVDNDSISNPETQINDGLKAYTDAVSILQDNNLPVDHNFVCILSTYILSTKDITDSA